VSGTVDLLEDNYAAALPHLEQAAPENPPALFYRAEALRLKGDVAGAAAMYRKVVALNANSMYYALVRARAMKWAQP